MIFGQAQQTPIAHPAAPDADEMDTLRFVRECSGKDDPYLYAMRGAAYTSILFTHGLQHYAYSLTTGQMVDTWDEYDDRSRVVFNVILPVIEAQIALLIAKAPEKVVEPTTRDDRDIEAAHYATDVLKWADAYHNVQELMEEAANQLTKTGNVFLFAGWDPTGGRFFMTEDGRMVFEGDPLVKVLSLFQVTLHPSAKSYRDSPYCHISEMVSRDWLDEHYPEVAATLPERASEVSSDGGLMFESRLLNLSPSHGGYNYFGSDTTRRPRGESFFELHTVYVRSSPRRPKGRMIVALAQNGSATKVLFDGENPYTDWSTGKRTLPIVHIKALPVPGRLLGESLALHMMPMQNSINRHRGQIHDNAALNANPRMFKPEGIAVDQITDDPGQIIDVPLGANPPGYIPAPELPAYLLNCEEAALQFIEILTRPHGPLQAGQEKITSGIHQMIVEEQKKQAVAPMMRRWENGWDAFWKLYLDNFRTFAEIPRRVRVVGDNDQWRETYFSGALARSNIVVSIKEGSAMPTTRTAVFAEWVELIKAGAAPVQLDPALARYFWKDIGRPEIARTYRDNTVHIDKARRNIQRVRIGETVMATPLDEPDPHIIIYRNWANTPEAEMEAQQDPTFMPRFLMLLQSFEMLQQQRLAMQQALLAQAAGGANPGEDRVQKANQKQPGQAGGDGGFPRQTQGFGNATPIQSPPRAGETQGIAV